MRVDDASGEVEGGLLQGQRRTAFYPQVHFTLLGFTFRPRKARGAENRMFTSFLPGASADALKRMRRRCEAGASSSDIGDTCRTGEAMQSGDTRLVELLRAFYRTAMHKLYRYIDQSLSSGQTQYRRCCGASAQRGMATQDEDESPGCSFTGVLRETRLVMGAV